MAEYLKKYDVISFDIFDTLILRKFGRPEDVFYLVQQKLDYPNFKKMRQEAEADARNDGLKKKGHAEITCYEIWERLEKISGIDKNIGIQAEWEAELKSCYANPYFVELIKVLKKRGKRLVVCSDMYWGCDKIKELLLGCGFPEFDDYFISSDYGCSKGTGELYDVLKEKCGKNNSYVHIGDNKYSDVKQAKKKNIVAIHYHNVHEIGEEYRAKDMSPLMNSIYLGIVNCHIHNGLRERKLAYEFGYIYGGLFVTGYCQFIHKYVKNNQIEKILFLSRDGDVLNKAYQLMYPEEGHLCKYVYWSRLAATKMCAPYFKNFYIKKMVDDKVNQKYTLEEIVRTMQLEDMLPAFIKWGKMRYHSESMFDSKLAAQFKAYIELNWKEVCEHYLSETEEGKNYFSKILYGVKRAVAIDVGWVGSGPLALSYLISDVWNLECRLTGILAGTCGEGCTDYEGTEMDLAQENLKSYLFSASENRDLWKIHNVAKGHNLIVELLLCSGNPSFRGFIKNEDNSYMFNGATENIDSEAVQQGILDFVKDYMSHPFADLNIAGRDAAAPIFVLYKNEKWIKKIISNVGIKANVE